MEKGERAALYERVAAGVDRLRERHGGDDGDLLLIAHGGSLIAAVVRLLGLPSDSMESASCSTTAACPPSTSTTTASRR